MGIIAPITIVFLHLVAVALDIIVVFILARLLSAHLSWKWVVAFNTAGRPLTDAVLSTIDRGFSSAQHDTLRENSRIALALLGVLLLRLLCSAIAGAVS